MGMAARRCDRVAGAAYRMGGVFGDYLRAVTEQWLKTAPRANPALVEMFRDRDRRPLRDLTMFAGEFAGKYLTGAVQVLRLTRDPELRRTVAEVVRALVGCQGEDGYLGPWPSESALTNRAPNSMLGAPLWTTEGGGDTWDTWGHYHLMLGLLLWHRDTSDDAALRAARRMADLLCERYLGDTSPPAGGHRLAAVQPGAGPLARPPPSDNRRGALPAARRAARRRVRRARRRRRAAGR